MNEKLPRLDMIRSGYPGSGQHGNNNNNNVVYENLNSFATFASDAFLDGTYTVCPWNIILGSKFIYNVWVV